MERQTHTIFEGQTTTEPDRVRQLSHDLRHCLYTVRTGTQLLRQSLGASDGACQILTLMEDDQDRAAQLVDELLALVGRPATVCS